MSAGETLGPVQSIVNRLCELQREVRERHLGFDATNDCFCGEGGFWPASTASWPFDPPASWRNTGEALDWIEMVVHRALDQEEQRLPRYVAIGHGPDDLVVDLERRSVVATSPFARQIADGLNRNPIVEEEPF